MSFPCPTAENNWRLPTAVEVMGFGHDLAAPGRHRARRDQDHFHAPSHQFGYLIHQRRHPRGIERTVRTGKYVAAYLDDDTFVFFFQSVFHFVVRIFLHLPEKLSISKHHTAVRGERFFHVLEPRGDILRGIFLQQTPQGFAFLLRIVHHPALPHSTRLSYSVVNCAERT